MRLLIVDDHEVVRRGVRSLLSEQAGWDVCGEAVDGQDAVEKALALKPDLIVMDVSMPRLNGLEATRQVRSILPSCEVLVLSQHENNEMARQALKAGARGYVVKSSISRDLISAVAKACRHEYFFDPAILDRAPTTHTDVQEILQRSAAFEKALRESEEHLQLVTKSMAASVARCSKDLRYLWANQGYADWLRRHPEQIIGKQIVDVLGRDAFDQLLPYFKRALSGERVSYEAEVPYQSIGRRWISATYTPTLDSQGAPDGWVAVVLDITERKRTQEALHESQEQFALALESSRTGMFEWDLIEHRGKWNPQMAAIYDFSPNGAYITAEEWRSLFHPDDIKRLAEEADCVWRGMGKHFKFEFRTVRRNGEVRWMLSHGRIVRDAKGNALRMIGTHTDITEHKQHEAAIATGARQQKALFHLADELHRARSMEDVYNAALNAILDALQCNRASILLCDDAGVMRFRSWRGLSSEYRAATDGHSAWRPDEKNPQPVCVSDINMADFSESLKAAVKREGIGALAFIPLVSNSRLIGKFMVYFNTPHEFTEDEINLSQTIARQLSFAIDRMRNDEVLEQSKVQLAKEAESLRKLNECSSRLWRLRNLHDGLEEMLNAVIGLLGAEKGIVQILDPQRRVLTVEAQRGFEKAFLEFFREVSADDDNASGRALRAGERVVIEDIEGDAPYSPLREVARAAGYRAVVSTPLIGKDGAALGMLSTYFSRPHRPSDQELRRLDLYVRQAADFVERCRNEESLRTSDKATALLAAIVSSSDDAIVSKNLDGIIQSWNKSAERMFGYSAEEAIGQHITLIIPQDRHAEETDILNRLRRGERVDHFQTVRRRKDGALIDVSLTISPVRDSSGRVIGASKVARDITAQKRAERELRESEQRYQAVTDASPIMIWMSGTDKLCYYFNKGWLDFVGRTLEQESGNGWAENVHPNDFDRCLQIYVSNFDARRPFEMEYRLRHRSGQYRWIFDRGVPRFAPDGTFEGYVGGCLDIHSQKEAAKKVRIADETVRLMKIQDEERRRIARELHDSAGQTLTVLGLSLAQLVQKAEGIAPELVKDGKEIEEVVQQLHREIRTTSYLLHPPLLEECGLASALNWYVEGLSRRSGIAIKLDIAENLGRLPNDMELAVFRLVQECLTNIHRHSGSKTADIRVFVKSGNLCLEVTDEGRGIPPERLTEIRAGGSGVGIRGMQERLRQFGGELIIESDGPGASVIASIPVPNEAPSADSEPLQAAL